MRVPPPVTAGVLWEFLGKGASAQAEAAGGGGRSPPPGQPGLVAEKRAVLQSEESSPAPCTPSRGAYSESSPDAMAPTGGATCKH